MLIELIKENRVDEVVDYYNKNGIDDILEALASFTNRANYFKIKLDGTIKRKKMSLALPIINRTLKKELSIKESLEIILNESLFRENYKKSIKIERATKYSVEELKNKFFKVIIKSKSKYARTYAKELLLRDRDSFEEVMRMIIIIARGKEDLALVFENIMELIDEFGVKDYYIYSLIDYLASEDLLLGRYEDFKESGYKRDIQEMSEHVKDDMYALYYLKNAVRYFEITKNKNRRLEEFVLREIENEKINEFTKEEEFYKKLMD